MPAFSALSLYAGHAGSITIISFPGFNKVEIARKTENLAPGDTKMFCGFVLVSNLLVTYFARVSLNSAIPFESPYFVYLLLYISVYWSFIFLGGSILDFLR